MIHHPTTWADVAMLPVAAILGYIIIWRVAEVNRPDFGERCAELLCTLMDRIHAKSKS